MWLSEQLGMALKERCSSTLKSTAHASATAGVLAFVCCRKVMVHSVKYSD